MFRAFRSAAIVAGLLSVLYSIATPSGRAQNFTDIEPSPQQVEWQDLEFGVIIHFGPNHIFGPRMGRRHGGPQPIHPHRV